MNLLNYIFGLITILLIVIIILYITIIVLYHLLLNRFILMLCFPINKNKIKNKLIKLIVIGNLNKSAKQDYRNSFYVCPKHDITKNELNTIRDSIIFKIDNNIKLNPKEYEYLNDMISINFHRDIL